MWADFFPDTPPGIAGAQLSDTWPIVARGLLDFCDLQTEIAVHRASARSYASFILAIKVRARAQLLAKQRAALIKVLLERDIARIEAQGGLDGWTVLWTQAPPPPPPAPPSPASSVDLN